MTVVRKRFGPYCQRSGETANVVAIYQLGRGSIGMDMYEAGRAVGRMCVRSVGGCHRLSDGNRCVLHHRNHYVL